MLEKGVRTFDIIDPGLMRDEYEESARFPAVKRHWRTDSIAVDNG